MKKPVTVPLDQIKRWVEAENAFIEAVSARVAARFSDLKTESAATDVMVLRLRELHQARAAFTILAMGDQGNRPFVEAVFAYVEAEARNK